jgi:hypothetical protein
MTAETGQPTAETGQSGHASLTGQPGQVSLERTEKAGLSKHDSSVRRRATDKVAGARKLEQDS